MSILNLLRRSKADTAASLSADVERADGEASQADERLAALTARRAAALTSADDATIDRLDRELVVERRNADRARAVATELRQRHAAQLELEARLRLDELAARGEQLNAEAVELIHTKYPGLARQLVSLARRLTEIDDEVARINADLTAAGDGRRVPDYDPIARPAEPNRTTESSRLSRVRFVDQLQAPSGQTWYVLLWPPLHDAGGRPLSIYDEAGQPRPADFQGPAW